LTTIIINIVVVIIYSPKMTNSVSKQMAGLHEVKKTAAAAELCVTITA